MGFKKLLAVALSALLSVPTVAIIGIRDAVATIGPSFGQVDVMAYGAKGNNTTDDTAAIQAALTAVGEGTLVFPSHQYKVTASLAKTIAANKSLRLLGIGNAELVFSASEPGSETGLFDITGTPTSNLTIENLKLTETGGISTQGLWDGVRVYNATPAAKSFGTAILRNVRASGWSHDGVLLQGVSAGLVEGAQLNANNYAGLVMSGCQSVSALGNTFNANGYSANTSVGYGASAATQFGYGQNSNLLFQGNTANDNHHKGIDVHDGKGVVIDSNFVKFNTGGDTATPAGIYADNEGGTKVVQDVKITKNTIDCTGAVATYSPIVGIQVGSFGTTATDPGTMLVEGNTVTGCNNGTTALAILIDNPSTGSAQPSKLVVQGNQITTGSGTNTYPIKINNNAINWKDVVVAFNLIQTAQSFGGIALQSQDHALVQGNQVRIDAGTPTYGIYVLPATDGVVSGNNVFGGATYTNGVTAAGSQQRGNVLQGVALQDTATSFADITTKGPVIDVRAYGAKCDGTTDDTTAIQAAFTALKTAGGGTLFFPPGKTVLCNSQVGSTSSTDLINGVTISGYGATFKSGLTAGANIPAMQLYGSRDNVLGLTFGWTTAISTATITGNYSEESCLLFGGTSSVPQFDFTVRDCTFNGSFYAAIRPTRCSRVTIENNYMHDCLATSIFPAEVASDLKIARNTILASGDDAIFVGAGSAAAATRRVLIANNQIKDGNAKGIGVGGVWDGVIEGNAITNTWAQGIDIESNPTWSTDLTKTISIRGNTLRDVGQFYGTARHAAALASSCGIYASTSPLGNITDVSILSNQITNCNATGISMAYITNLAIAKNLIDGASIGMSVGFSGAADSLTNYNVACEGNIVKNVTADGIDLYRSTLVNCRNNIVQTYGAAGGAVDRGIFGYFSDRLQTGGNQILNDNSAEATIAFVSCTNSSTGDDSYGTAGSWTAFSAANLSSANTWPLAQTFSSTVTANTLASSGFTGTGGTLNNMSIGATTASTGAFTTLSGTGLFSLAKTAQAATAETLATWSVSDDATAKLEVLNFSAANNFFLPEIKGTSNGNNQALYLIGAMTTDSGGNPAIVIDGRTAANTAITTAGLLDVRNNGTSEFTIGNSGNATLKGAFTPTGGEAAAGGFAVSPRLMYSGGKPAASAADGTDTAFVVTQTQVCEVFVPANATLTGVSMLNGSVVAGNVIVGLYSSAGTLVANSALAGTAQAGTNAYQRVPFTGTYAAVGPATYYIAVQGNNATGKFRPHAFGDFGCYSQTAQTFGTLTSITAPTTFAANTGPIASLY